MTSTLTRPRDAPRSSRARGGHGRWASRPTPALLRAARLVVVLVDALQAPAWRETAAERRRRAEARERQTSL